VTDHVLSDDPILYVVRHGVLIYRGNKSFRRAYIVRGGGQSYLIVFPGANLENGLLPGLYYDDAKSKDWQPV
jgi:hypothetical protein